ncbi:hypothetical protein [Pseudomonas asiatica]|uniref:hypothetical protein n=1 Tax=Pseudomonas asiatica TaxID=2219225 RepID=UPI0025A3652B|nr:hypothetical protein [Pseudomonas asiatica]WJN49507.1 hypothetical protein QUR91_23105 [Pseudomonas asiatica]
MSLRVSEFSIVGAVCSFVVFWAGPIESAPGRICGGEHTLFQCSVRGGEVALCSNYIDGELSGVQFRFVREGGEGFMFPDSGFSFDSFKSNHFFRYQVDYKLVKFSVGSHIYSLYSNYDGGDGGGGQKNAGVLISDSSGKAVDEMPCLQIVADNLGEAILRMKCDMDDALGCK